MTSLLSRSHKDSPAGLSAVITGGSRGLGLLLAEQVLIRGCAVAIAARDEQELDRARELLTSVCLRTARRADLKCAGSSSVEYEDHAGEEREGRQRSTPRCVGRITPRRRPASFSRRKELAAAAKAAGNASVVQHQPPPPWDGPGGRRPAGHRPSCAAPVQARSPRGRRSGLSAHRT
jgi:hypothetical protein